MFTIDFQHPVHIYFIGIGGISMSGLAKVLCYAGFPVSGSDSKKTDLTTRLEQDGMTIHIGQRASNITDDIELVVYTAAIHPDNPEYAAAVEKKIPMLSRAELLGQIMKNYKHAIAVSGTHGKTTTTSMLSHVLLEAQKDPTISVGGILPIINGNIRVGSSEYFLTEACEYTNSFLHFYPRISIILNIEEDHMDFFKDLADIRNSFHLFAQRIPQDGVLILNGDIDHPEEITENVTGKILTYEIADSGKSSACQYYTDEITYDAFAHPTFSVFENMDGTPHSLGKITLNVTGRHNVSNALAVIAAARSLSLDFETIRNGLLAFSGTDRRFQKKGMLGSITIMDDYAHHPTEIRATLTTAEKYPHNRILCVFQPHTYSRTKAFFEEFAKALSLADIVYLADIYAARETDTLGVSSKQLAEAIEKLGTKAYYFSSFDEIENDLLKTAEDGDLILTMGAGDVYQIGDSLLGNK